ncbi:MAG TPA: prolipoprotein diacylglyceryl transferase family protein [Candidatus Limnocylindrales bacterium]
MPLAVIALDFDPTLHLGDRSVRLETLALAAAVLVMLAIAALIAGRTPAAAPGVRLDGDGGHLRRDDLLFIALGVVPGAVAGGRLVYGLIHLDYYSTVPAAFLDPGQGSLHLAGAVVGGSVTGSIVARLLEASVGRWLSAATVPLLVGLALGKFAMALGGAGQGALWDGAWATSYVRDATWGSLAADLPAHPSQVYEAATALAALLLVLLLARSAPFRRAPARRYLAAIALWSLGRLAVAATWRDAAVLGPLRAEQLVDLALCAGCLVLVVVVGRRRAPAAALAPAWPDPATRPRF